MRKKNLNGRFCIVTSDNELYDSFRDKVLKITHTAYNTDEHIGYDWELQDEFKCVFNEGYFKNTETGYCYDYKSNTYSIATVIRKDKENSFYVTSLSEKVFRTEEEAILAI